MMPTATENHSPRLAKNLDSRGENLCIYVTNLYLRTQMTQMRQMTTDYTSLIYS